MFNVHRNARKETAIFPKNFRKVAEALKGALGLHKSCADCFAAFIITAVEAKSILLGEVAKRLPGTARGKSKFHRLQDFFRESDSISMPSPMLHCCEINHASLSP